MYREYLRRHFPQGIIAQGSVRWYLALCNNTQNRAVSFDWYIWALSLVNKNSHLLKNLGDNTVGSIFLQPSKKVNCQSWLDSSLLFWHLTAANSLINLINVIRVGFGAGCHCSADSAVEPPHSAGLWFSKGWLSELLWGRLLCLPFQHQELSMADSSCIQQWLTSC